MPWARNLEGALLQRRDSFDNDVLTLVGAHLDLVSALPTIIDLFGECISKACERFDRFEQSF